MLLLLYHDWLIDTQSIVLPGMPERAIDIGAHYTECSINSSLLTSGAGKRKLKARLQYLSAGLQSMAFLGKISGMQSQIARCARADIPVCYCVPTNLI